MGKLLAVFAHPDDESCMMGGTIAKYVNLGHVIYLATATRGESGTSKEYQNRAVLAKIREGELKKAAKILGIRRTFILGLPDENMGWINQQKAINKVKKLMIILKPDVVVTLDRDGITGHPDHMITSKIVTEAFNKWGNDMNKIKKLYYITFCTEILGSKKVETKKREATLVENVKDFMDKKMKAIQAHKSQQEVSRECWNGEAKKELEKEYFKLAYPISKKEKSLFDKVN